MYFPVPGLGFFDPRKGFFFDLGLFFTPNEILKAFDFYSTSPGARKKLPRHVGA